MYEEYRFHSEAKWAHRIPATPTFAQLAGEMECCGRCAALRQQDVDMTPEGWRTVHLGLHRTDGGENR